LRRTKSVTVCTADRVFARYRGERIKTSMGLEIALPAV
jgi:hypothetical protein